MKISKYLLTVSLGLLPLSAIASQDFNDPFKNDGFVKDNWQVVCDNTLTCRAAGYADYFDTYNTASILLIAAPKSKLPQAQVYFLSKSTEDKNQPVELWLNGKSYGAIKPTTKESVYTLTANQTRQLLKRARQNTKIEVGTRTSKQLISDKGMTSVLLKLDEVQGRVGNSLALVSKHRSKRQRPKSIKQIPVIKKANVYPDEDHQALDAKTLTSFQNNITKWIDINDNALIGFNNDGMGNCELINPKTEAYQSAAQYDEPEWEFTPLDAKHTLASHICWRAAYNGGSGYWVINNAKPNNPKRITMSGTGYTNGEIESYRKGRGAGDCISSTTWTWDGNTFEKSEEFTTGLCRGVTGGTWKLPMQVAKVVGSAR